MRFMRNLIRLILLLIFVAFFSINSGTVEVNFFPKDFLARSTVLQLPLFIIMVVFCILGFLAGSFSEYLRSYSQRKVARQKVEEVKILNNEIRQLRSKNRSETEEILNVLK